MNIKDFSDSLDYLFKAQVTPFVWGHAGIGKSSIIKQYANRKGYHYFPFYLGTMSDTGDILGLADFVKDKDGNTVATSFAMPIWLRDAIKYCQENPDSGAVIFLDEFNRGRRDILNGMFSLALDKTFHTIKLPKNCHVVAAGNPPTDEYFTTDVNETALMARFVHVKLEPTFQEWIQYANNSGIEPTLVGFLREQPELLEDSRSSFELPVKVDRRSYERLSRLFQVGTPKHLLQQLMAGVIGLTRTIAYETYLKNDEKPLTGEQVLKGELKERVARWSDTSDIKSSLLNITCENLLEEIKKLNDVRLLDDSEKSNLIGFLRIIPKDISFPVIKKLVETKNKPFVDFMKMPEYEQELVKMIKNARGSK